MNTAKIDLEKLFEASGNKHRYQYLILFFAFSFCIFLEILPVSLPFLEKTSMIRIYDNDTKHTDMVPLNYSLCQDKSYPENILEQSKHSWVIEFNIECDKLKTGLIGSFSFMGVLIGSLLFQFVPDRIGRRKTVLISLTAVMIILTMFTFIHNIYQAWAMSFILQIFANLGYFTIYILVMEITSQDLRSVFGAIMSSAYSFSGVLFITFFWYFNNWRINFMIAVVMSSMILSQFWRYAYESPRFYYMKNDIAGTNLSFRHIAAFNHKDKEYQEIARGVLNSTDEERESCISKNIPAETQLKQNQLPTICSNTDNQGFLSLLHSKSIRLTFLINCFLWFSTSGSYYGLSINIKNLPGDIYLNGIFIYISEVFAYILSGWLINRPAIGRKMSLILFEMISLSGNIVLLIFKFDNYMKTIMSFIARFAVSGVYNIIYTYSAEVYPTVIKAKGMGMNSICGRLGGILFPLLLELLSSNIGYLFTFINLLALLLVFPLPETYGKALQDQIVD